MACIYSRRFTSLFERQAQSKCVNRTPRGPLLLSCSLRGLHLAGAKLGAGSYSTRGKMVVVIVVVNAVPLEVASDDADSSEKESQWLNKDNVKGVNQNTTFVNSSSTEMLAKESAANVRKRGLWSWLFGDPVDKKKEVFIGYLSSCSDSRDDAQDLLYRGMLGFSRVYTTDDLDHAKRKAREACKQATMPVELSTPIICLISIKAYMLSRLRKAFVPSNVPDNCCTTMPLHYHEDNIGFLEDWLFKGHPPASRDVVRFSKVSESRQGNPSVPFHAAWHWKQIKYMTEKCYPADDVIDVQDKISYQKLLSSSSDPNFQGYPYWGRVAGAKYVNVYPPPFATWGLTY
ncbi:hypothetical protein BKA69DRAFT_1143504 [Paraphysoderma sedebokerense]|nr:hypothetical protein BKA69DRAFT_1143504 [Paraphysoderma sedebokerense]